MERVRVTEGKSRIPFVIDDKESSIGIHPVLKKGDILFFDFSAKSEDGKRVLLFFAATKSGKRIRFREDDKIFLGIFPDEREAKSFAFQTISLLESILGVRMSFSIKKETIIAVIS